MCSAEVTLTDKNTGEVITFGNTDLNFSSTLMDIAFTNERLALNQQYGFTVNASNINGSAISSGDISKLKPVFRVGACYVVHLLGNLLELYCYSPNSSHNASQIKLP